jgi:hypothetical protein
MILTTETQRSQRVFLLLSCWENAAGQKPHCHDGAREVVSDLSYAQGAEVFDLPVLSQIKRNLPSPCSLYLWGEFVHTDQNRFKNVNCYYFLLSAP